MICGMTYFQICLYFLIYSFGGWVVEVIFHAVALGKVINRGFLNGPVCPVYGFGVLSVFALLNTIQGSGRQMSDGMIFVFGIVLATAVELVAGWLLDVCFHARWWDYSDKPFNFHGYICLEFSLIWGLAIVMVVKVFQKYVEAHALHTPATWEWIVIAVLYAVYLTDFIHVIHRYASRHDTSSGLYIIKVWSCGTVRNLYPFGCVAKYREKIINRPSVVHGNSGPTDIKVLVLMGHIDRAIVHIPTTQVRLNRGGITIHHKCLDVFLYLLHGALGVCQTLCGTSEVPCFCVHQSLSSAKG